MDTAIHNNIDNNAYRTWHLNDALLVLRGKVVPSYCCPILVNLVKIKASVSSFLADRSGTSAAAAHLFHGSTCCMFKGTLLHALVVTCGDAFPSARSSLIIIFYWHQHNIYTQRAAAPWIFSHLWTILLYTTSAGCLNYVFILPWLIFRSVLMGISDPSSRRVFVSTFTDSG